MTFLHRVAAVVERPRTAEYVPFVAVGFDNMFAMKKPETAAASVTDGLEYCFAQPSLAPTAVKLEQVA